MYVDKKLVDEKIKQCSRMHTEFKIYIAGHGGLLGSALCKKLESEGYQNIIERMRVKLDLTNQEVVDRSFKIEQPEIRYFRYRNKETAHLHNQQLLASCSRYRPFVQVPLAGRIVLQMDQAALANQSILWHYRERGQNPNLDRHLRLRAGSYYQETSVAPSQSLHNSTDIECDIVRENAHFTSSLAY